MVNTNVRGELAGKLDEIKVMKDNYGVDVIAITWYTSNIRGLIFTGGTDKPAANAEVSPDMFKIRFQQLTRIKPTRPRDTLDNNTCT